LKILICDGDTNWTKPDPGWQAPAPSGTCPTVPSTLSYWPSLVNSQITSVPNSADLGKALMDLLELSSGPGMFYTS